jgi:fructose-1,6-bisphosphatase I
MAGQPLLFATDGATDTPDLAAHLRAAAGADATRQALARIVLAIAEAAVPVALRLALGEIPGDPAAIVGTNESGDRQKALDVATHDHFVACLRGTGVRSVLSEEAEDAILLDPSGGFDVAIDPIDGSGSIGIGAPLGTLFAIFPAGGFLRPGREVVAAGYVSFGHSTDLGVSLGDGVAIATLDPRDGTFRVVDRRAAIPPETAMLAYNASNLADWDPRLAAYVAGAMAGGHGKPFNMRWIAAAVGDLHRILRRGGVFLYPADRRPAYRDGYLRLTYEAFPIAFLVEQAGGAATDGTRPILDRTATAPHVRTPLIFGSRAEVARITRHLET